MKHLLYLNNENFRLQQLPLFLNNQQSPPIFVDQCHQMTSHIFINYYFV